MWQLYNIKYHVCVENTLQRFLCIANGNSIYNHMSLPSRFSQLISILSNRKQSSHEKNCAMEFLGMSMGVRSLSNTKQIFWHLTNDVNFDHWFQVKLNAERHEVKNNRVTRMDYRVQQCSSLYKHCEYLPYNNPNLCMPKKHCNIIYPALTLFCFKQKVQQCLFRKHTNRLTRWKQTKCLPKFTQCFNFFSRFRLAWRIVISLSNHSKKQVEYKKWTNCHTWQWKFTHEYSKRPSELFK